ncbi:hypothetical protein T439DRAFT_377778 [Meredithblackwellia eburnea MCA 4105]
MTLNFFDLPPATPTPSHQQLPPPYSASSPTTTSIRTNKQHILTVDLCRAPGPFDELQIRKKLAQGEKHDWEKVQALFQEFETLSREFDFWTFAKVQYVLEDDAEKMNNMLAFIHKEENKENAGRDRLKSFVATFKSAFFALTRSFVSPF